MIIDRMFSDALLPHLEDSFNACFRPLCDVVVGQVRGFLNFVCYLEHMLVFDFFLLSALFKVQP